MKVQYEHDLPSVSTFDQEVHKWRALCKSNDNQQITALSGALYLALSTTRLFPNTETVLSLLLSLPVGSCCCERSFSTMRRLKTWQRSSVGNIRFNGLALMNIHSDNDVGAIDLDDVLYRFDSTSHLRIGCVFTDTVSCVTQLSVNEDTSYT